MRQAVKSLWPFGYYFRLYSKSAAKVRSSSGTGRKLFQEFLSKCEGPCLQIAIKKEFGGKFGDNWVAVDKYDNTDDIDRHDDIEALDFPDASFNAVVCWSVMEHVPRPYKAIDELYRVLKPGGIIWMQVPFLYPFHADPYDYWRVTPSGLRMWMEKFEELACACDYWARTKIIAGTYYYGRKPLSAGAAPAAAPSI